MNYSFDTTGAVSQEQGKLKEKKFLLPCGRYEFTVKEVTLEDFKGSHRLPACPACVLTLDLDEDGERVGTIKDKLYSCELMSWKIEQLLEAVYPKVPDESLNLTQLVGKTGQLELSHGLGTDKSGDTYPIEQVKKYVKKRDFRNFVELA